eukprot:6173671-Pleurochrysis_carterae.AAC.1
MQTPDAVSSVFWAGGDVAGDVADDGVSSEWSEWVLLRSRYAGGFVTVNGQHEGDEYVVRVTTDGSLSYRSLLRFSPRAVWSAHSGYLNLRDAAPGQTRQPLRAHGNEQPWRPMRALQDSARMHVRTLRRVRGGGDGDDGDDSGEGDGGGGGDDANGGGVGDGSVRGGDASLLQRMRCALPAPPFDWNLLLDAARAGACDSTSTETLMRAAAAAAALETQMGDAFGAELPEMIAAYRQARARERCRCGLRTRARARHAACEDC